MNERPNERGLEPTMVVAGVLLLLALIVCSALLTGAETAAGAGVLVVWTVLLGWSLFSLRDRLSPAWWWGLAGAGATCVLAQAVLLLIATPVFMHVNFISLHVWAVLCAMGLAAYAFFAPREERLAIGLSVAGALVLVAQMPFTPRPLVAVFVAGALGVLPAGAVAWSLLRHRIAGAAGSPAGDVARKLPAWPDAETPGALISS
jgi:hypothetical protein